MDKEALDKTIADHAGVFKEIARQAIERYEGYRNKHTENIPLYVHCTTCGKVYNLKYNPQHETLKAFTCECGAQNKHDPNPVFYEGLDYAKAEIKCQYSEKWNPNTIQSTQNTSLSYQPPSEGMFGKPTKTSD